MRQLLSDITTPPKSSGRLVPFRFRQLGERVLLTNLCGDWVFVSPDELRALYRGELDGELEERLASRGFVRDRIDERELAARFWRRKRFLQAGPSLHMLIGTLRCNETCVYCHASRANMDQVSTDMSPETADKAIDLILQSTAPHLRIEFQGGEPLANFPLIEHVIKSTLRKNAGGKKQVEFTLVSNLSLMTEEKLDFLVKNKVQICTSVDGPEKLHNKQRVLPSGNAYQQTASWMKRINERYVELGLDPVVYHVEALLTTTRASLDLPREIIDTYIGLGCRSIFLRPVDPFGFASKTRGTIEYERRRYLDFYARALDYILELNEQGTYITERYAAIFLTKILTGEDPNFLDIQSPSGAGVGGLAYNYDGNIFMSDEGRMLHETGDDSFLIGHVSSATYRDLVTHDTVRACLVASNLDAQVDCVNCTYTPYCGLKPENNYTSHGSIQGRTRESHMCQVHKGIQDVLFQKLADASPAVLDVFARWTQLRDRDHFVYGDDP